MVPRLAGIWMNERIASISMLILQVLGLVLARRQLEQFASESKSRNARWT